MENAHAFAANGNSVSLYTADDIIVRVDQMAQEILSEKNEINEFEETLMTQTAEFEQHRTEVKCRNRSIKSFATTLQEFLGDTKSKLIKMITQFDEVESQRKQLGPLMPAGKVTFESFSALADTFM